MTKEIVFTENAPAPIGPYSQAIIAEGKLLFISGQIPYTADGKLAGDNITEQAHQSCKNLGAILEAAGADYNNVVKTTVLLKDMADFATVNKIYNEYFGESKPARAAYQVAKLPLDVMVEIEAIAVL